MKALAHKGERDVASEDARVVEPTEAVVRITTTNICGSNLHMFEGRTSLESGTVLGHETISVVEALGSGVTRVREGDRVSVPLITVCGSGCSCVEGSTSFCELTNPIDGMQGDAYGYATISPYAQGEARFLRVPFADVSLSELPQGTESENTSRCRRTCFRAAPDRARGAGRRRAHRHLAEGRWVSYRRTAPACTGERSSSSTGTPTVWTWPVTSTRRRSTSRPVTR
ncbi:alcohol dehydrogenase catalytic domain-containing protein [Phycicoccus sp. MAQZ13P-2]|uniref:alcohol dehydrogenase catalytic domain-containing protein n=1 Tax=Phycicoccus mangrovi TaxID=2840470 RepID=UPI001BFFDE67|nr:alcohol dehydrogenase catalytic domain-containing protein [Phycicoccus mangrovi]MBT9257468.1 alcohol dehydrogenase catalytic domain-containing protein [Phycicoccus mangrovi]MBT9275658.1 alcohol dehydrogenase catalytic domain-containing protein [Phycicoccus mangrovi]